MEPLPPFDELKWLAKHDPEALDKLQEQYTQAIITATHECHRHQLTCIQHNLMLRLSRCHSANERSYVAMTILTEKLNHLSSVIEQADTGNIPACILTFEPV
ncbi:DUF3135 domain-containing protein [uncultured Shewanella sp.]|uniref:DUF3135 domain-containing protein n=1 Tax=uncultured Shewanella sp. TaxID=173975 RepID=UPI002634B40E|nr:DUF3135 domain-containing protein [uncultured Shewanella sp.]